MTISPDQARDRSRKGYAGLSRSFEDRAAGDRELAERLRSEHYSELGKRSGSRRRAKAAARRAALKRQADALGLTTEDELLAMAQQKR